MDTKLANARLLWQKSDITEVWHSLSDQKYSGWAKLFVSVVSETEQCCHINEKVDILSQKLVLKWLLRACKMTDSVNFLSVKTVSDRRVIGVEWNICILAQNRLQNSLQKLRKGNTSPPRNSKNHFGVELSFIYIQCGSYRTSHSYCEKHKDAAQKDM